MADDGDEDYVFFGTPILREDEFTSRKKKKVSLDSGQVKKLPVWQQEVTDEEGRRRFHGAFTGGFSAGFYNTVGSKEGFTPQVFTSSRKKRAESRNQSIQDFLDDDEKQELEANDVNASQQFDTFGFTAVEIARKQAERESQKRPSAIPGPFPDEIVVPVIESIGIKLLTKMGWRYGRSVGATYMASISDSRREARKAFLALGTNSESSKEEENGERPFHLEMNTIQNEKVEDLDATAVEIPHSTPVFILSPKTDLHGLGYDPFKGAPEFKERKEKHGLQNKASQKHKSLFHPNAGKTASGFGLGALEDIDEDDEDIYTSSLDFSIAPDEDENTPIVRNEKKRSKLSSNDHLCLPGFQLASVSDCRMEWFIPPVVPSGFVPQHKFCRPLEMEQELSEVPPPETEPPGDIERRMMIEGLANFVARSGKLFEDLSKEKNASNPSFSFLFGGPDHEFYQRKLWEEKNRLAKLGKNASELSFNNKKKLNAEERGRVLGETPLERTQKNDKETVVMPYMANLQSALSDTFTKSVSMVEENSIVKPFQNNPAKQSRFEQFVRDKYQGGLRSGYVEDNLTEVERAQERMDFEAAIEARDKSKGIQKSSISTNQNFDSILAAGDRFTKGAAEPLAVENVNADVKRVAVRSEHEWRPSPLLCKRFQIVDPYAGKPPPMPKAKSKQDSFLTIPEAFASLTQTPSAAEVKSFPGENQESLTKASETEEENGTMDSKDAVLKKPVDLYKAIFSDESDSEIQESSEKVLDTDEKTAEGANATLNRLIASDFLESLGKELGLQVAPDLENMHKKTLNEQPNDYKNVYDSVATGSYKEISKPEDNSKVKSSLHKEENTAFKGVTKDQMGKADDLCQEKVRVKREILVDIGIAQGMMMDLNTSVRIQAVMKTINHEGNGHGNQATRKGLTLKNVTKKSTDHQDKSLREK